MPKTIVSVQEASHVIHQEGGKFGPHRTMCPLHPEREAHSHCFVRFPGTLEALQRDREAGHREDAGVSTGGFCCHTLYPTLAQNDSVRDT
ncbi:MAG: hypothetical protein Q7S04_03215 [Candidatus Moranbacteria bacterium]|nr:hypothetical protein [Candidatus Moranbacteria bacterium]